jgi:Xaa-Pro aminopeptidase
MPKHLVESLEVLETGMTFSLEPAIYIERFGGARDCDMVAVDRFPD